MRPASVWWIITMSMLTRLLHFELTERTGTIQPKHREISLGLPLPVSVHRNFYFLRVTILSQVPQLPQLSPMRITGPGSCFGITRSETTCSLKTTERKVTHARG